MPRTVPHALSSVIVDETAAVDGSQWRASLLEAVNRLPDRLAHVVIWRVYGEDGRPLTFPEIGRRLGVSHERARQLLQNAYTRLRPICKEFLQV